MGYADSQYRLGVMYSKGRSLEQNDVMAANYFDKAAQQGNTAAMCDLGCMHAIGK